MTRFKTIVAFAAVATAFGVGNAAAQMTIAQIDPAAPFGTMTVNVDNLSNTKIRAFNNSLNGAQQTELKERCVLIRDPANRSKYAPLVGHFCDAFVSLYWDGAAQTAAYGGATPPTTAGPLPLR